MISLCKYSELGSGVYNDIVSNLGKAQPIIILIFSGTKMKEKIISLLGKLHIEYRWVDHPAVFTVEESKQHIKDMAPIKNLLLQEKNNGRLFLVTMPGETRLDMKQLAAKLNTKKLQFASTDTMENTLGVTPGAVSIFGLLYKGSDDIEVIIDESLPKEKDLGFHPNVNTATIFIAGSALVQIIKETGHKYQLLKF